MTPVKQGRVGRDCCVNESRSTNIRWAAAGDEKSSEKWNTTAKLKDFNIFRETYHACDWDPKLSSVAVGWAMSRGPASSRQNMSPSHNLQVITIHNYLRCRLWASYARGWNFNRFANFGLWIARKRVWRPRSAWTRWESYSAPRPIAVIRGGEEGEWVGREGKGNKGWKGESRVRGRDKGGSGRWERVGLDLDICWGPSSSYYATAQAAGVGAWDGQPMRNCHDR